MEVLTFHDERLSSGFDFDFALSHYNIYPWARHGNILTRALCQANGRVAVVRIHRSGIDGICQIDVLTDELLQCAEANDILDTMIFCLGLDTDLSDVEIAAEEDPVLRTALEINKGIRPKRYASIFESVCGAICAQNVDFRRLYQMMELLCTSFGPRMNLEDDSYYSFPEPPELAQASSLELKRCKVGYRATRLQQAAEWFMRHGHELSREQLRSISIDEASAHLCEIPGVGPYSAAIVLQSGVGRKDVFQLDSFTRLILRQFYFDGSDVSDEILRKFVDERWQGFASSVAHLLTTNTHEWAEKLGVMDFRKSHALN